MNILNKANNFLKIATNLQPPEILGGFLYRGIGMRKIFVLIVCLYGMCAYAVGVDESTYDMSEAKTLMSQTEVFDKIGEDAFKDIENKILSINPQLVEQNADKSTNEKLIVYRSYLARASFDWYKEYFINKLKERSRQTGRQIKSEEGEHTIYLYLDNGRLDLPECQLEDWQICPYPDKHEDFYVTIEDFETYGEISLIEDDVARNIHQSFMVILSDDSKSIVDNSAPIEISSISRNLFVSTIYVQNSYDEWAESREKERATIAKFAPKSKKELREYRRKIKRGVKRGEPVLIEDIDKYDGLYIPPSLVISERFMSMYDSTNYKSHENQ